ncbi:MAG: hypothetical protein MUF10_03340 [Thermoanaerobaculaceae bacterium]|jgi:hypothetical protein|nr:hypothetical protein [Thermoanaerobaculaceae bacterium]
MRVRLLAVWTVLAVVAVVAVAEDLGWPKEIATYRGTLLVYQPQIDRFKGNVLEGRAAMSFTPTGTSEPIFGSFWFRALLETDFDKRTARLLAIQVPRLRFAGVTEEKQKEVGAFLEKEIPLLNIPISIDRLAAAMEETTRESSGAGAFKNDPPRVVISYEPAVLLFFDGQPILRDVEGQKGAYQRAVNTPLPVVRDVATGTLYLCGGEVWYEATDPLGPWSPTTKVPEPLLAMKREADRQRQASAGDEEAADAKDTPTSEKPPRVIVATEPTELIVVFGEANWSPIQDTGLLYVANSEGNIFKDIATQKTYVLLSGRWFGAPSLDGPWAFVPPDKLPRDFARIPETSPAANVLPSVPGTTAAKDALLDAQIPQTAVIKRSAVALDVPYDGAPQFKPIEGTTMEFAVNTSYSVIKLGARYYCCHQAVWYLADTPNGPWQVADKVPDDVYTIPPSNPHYNTTYVRVYDSTPEVVYTGYYPGYVNSYVYGGCVVYGTGWYYPPYVSPYFYHPWYPTWGFGVGWNPWTGWGVGAGWGYGPFTITVGFAGWGGYGGWYGPPGYHPPYYGGYPPRPGVPPGYRPPGGGGVAGSRPGGPQVTPHTTNLYARQQNAGRNASVPGDRSVRPADRVATGGANNVFADRNGDVYRRNSDGSWQQRDKGGWSSAGVGSGTRQGAGVSQQPAGLDRDYQARQRGSARTSSFQSSWGGSARGLGGGGRRR